MIGLLCFALAVLVSPFKSKLRLEAENASASDSVKDKLVSTNSTLARRAYIGRIAKAEFKNFPRYFLMMLCRIMWILQSLSQTPKLKRWRVDLSKILACAALALSLTFVHSDRDRAGAPLTIP
jgi:hypothetical protein